MSVVRQVRLRKVLTNLNGALGVVLVGFVGAVLATYLGAYLVAPAVFRIVDWFGYNADHCAQAAVFLGPLLSLPLCFIGVYSFAVLIPWLRSEINERPFVAALTFGLLALIVGCVLLIAEYNDPSQCWKP